MSSLSGAEKKRLKARAHHLKPVIMVGQKGMTESLVAAVDKALEDHELIKMKFIDFKEDKWELSGEIAGSTGSELVDIIGNMAILYREKEESV